MVKYAFTIREISMCVVCLHSQQDIHWVRFAFHVWEIFMVRCDFPVSEISMGEVCLPCLGDNHG